MTVEERLKHLILARYKSVSAFASAIGLPYTTVDSILKRGIENAGVGKVIKICKFLGISADRLADGEIAPYEISDMNLSSEEQELLKKYRALDDRGKRAVTETLEREFSYVKPFAEESAIATGAG